MVRPLIAAMVPSTKVGFVQGVGVNRDLDVVFVGDAQAAIDRGGSGAPVFVQFQADRAGQDLFGQTLRAGRCCLCR